MQNIENGADSCGPITVGPARDTACSELIHWYHEGESWVVDVGGVKWACASSGERVAEAESPSPRHPGARFRNDISSIDSPPSD